MTLTPRFQTHGFNPQHAARIIAPLNEHNKSEATGAPIPLGPIPLLSTPEFWPRKESLKEERSIFHLDSFNANLPQPVFERSLAAQFYQALAAVIPMEQVVPSTGSILVLDKWQNMGESITRYNSPHMDDDAQYYFTVTAGYPYGSSFFPEASPDDFYADRPLGPVLDADPGEAVMWNDMRGIHMRKPNTKTQNQWCEACGDPAGFDKLRGPGGSIRRMLVRGAFALQEEYVEEVATMGYLAPPGMTLSRR